MTHRSEESRTAATQPWQPADRPASSAVNTALSNSLCRVRYLSDEWLRAADEAVQTHAASAPEAALVIDQHVDGGASYRVTIARDRCSFAALGTSPEAADATFHQSLETATAVARGSTDAHQAFLLGQITFVGNAELLIERRDAFEWLETALAPVLAQTQFS